jgi:psiF repeat
MRLPDSRHLERSSSLARLRRAVRFTIVRAVLGALALGAAGVAAGPQAATVTARPPLEAVPAAPVSRAQRVRLRKCDAEARSRRLHGRKRHAFVQECIAPKPKPAKAPVRQARASH